MVISLVLAMLVFAGLAFATPSNSLRPFVVFGAATVHLPRVVLELVDPAASARPGSLAETLNRWVSLDDIGRLVLLMVSVLFFAAAVYAVSYLRLRRERDNRVLCTCLCLFLAMMTLATGAQHPGLLWVSIEATTLASAPMLYFNHNPRSLEATWKYLLIGSVGIALALLGTFFVAYASLQGGAGTPLFFADLVQGAGSLAPAWLRPGFILLFIGYGTKMGLAPMHTWKPDAYGETPGVVGALLAGGLTNCAFMTILRFYRVCVAAGEGAFARDLMLALGIVSMLVAGVFMARQRDYKRLLAYSSVEHMGILVLGVGIGGGAVFGSMLHMLNNALTKGVLFMSAGNIHRAYGSKKVEEVRGALRRVPVSAGLLLAGFFAITGAPPFGPFLSEFTILRAAIAGAHYGVAVAFLILLFIVFVGMGAAVLSVVQGDPSPQAHTTQFRDSAALVAPIIVLMAFVVLLGIYIPPPLQRMLNRAASFVGGTP